MYGLGYKPDARDPRDARFSALRLPAPPPAASLREHVVEILDQKNSSSCVANAWCQALRIADGVAGIKNPPLTSREFVYYGARKYDGGPITDDGTQLRSAAKALTKFGRPPESAWPFEISRINDQPSWEAFREAFDRKGPAGYVRVVGIDQMKQAIASGKAVVGGATVAQSIMDYAGGIYSPSSREQPIGGHAMCFCSYDPECFTITQSWGVGYGEAGFLRVSYAFAASFTDCWSVAN